MPSEVLNIDVCGFIVPLKLTVRDIGVVLDMSAQVPNACRGAYYNLFRIAKIRASLTAVACKSLAHSLVTSRLDYGNAILYGITNRLIHRLEMVRVVLRIKPFMTGRQPTSPLSSRLTYYLTYLFLIVY